MARLLRPRHRDPHVVYPGRANALLTIDPSKAKTRGDGKSLVVLAREKTDFGRGLSSLIIRDAPEERLSGVYFFHLLVDRATSLGVFHSLFCSERGVPYTSADVLYRALVRLLFRMGITGYTGYSFRSSLIQALFDAGLDEKQVNAYTGHSPRAHTAVQFYYRLDKQWAGEKIRARPTDRIPISEKTRKAIRESQENNEEEEEEV